jgi:6-phosphogluconate dehydrogenase
VITASLYARLRSRGNGDFADRVLASLRNQFGGHAVVSAPQASAKATANASARPTAKPTAKAPARGAKARATAGAGAGKPGSGRGGR